MCKKRAYIHYCEDDISPAKEVAWGLLRRGLDVCLIEGVKTAPLRQADDLYLVLISRRAMRQDWLKNELAALIKKNNGTASLPFTPVLLEEVELPEALAQRSVVDVRYSLQKAITELAALNGLSEQGSPDPGEPVLTGFSYIISDRTELEYGTCSDGVEEKDMEKCKERLLQDLRDRSRSIALSLTPPALLDFSADRLDLVNALTEIDVHKVSGDFDGNYREAVSVETTIFNPDMKLFRRLLAESLDSLRLSGFSFCYTAPALPAENLPELRKRCFSRLQEKQSLVSCNERGDFFIPIDVGLSMALRLSPDATYIWLHMTSSNVYKTSFKKFSLADFLEDMLAEK